MSVGGGSNCGGHPYISFLFRMNFFISCKGNIGLFSSVSTTRRLLIMLVEDHVSSNIDL